MVNISIVKHDYFWIYKNRFYENIIFTNISNFTVFIEILVAFLMLGKTIEIQNKMLCLKL